MKKGFLIVILLFSISIIMHSPDGGLFAAECLSVETIGEDGVSKNMFIPGDVIGYKIHFSEPTPPSTKIRITQRYSKGVDRVSGEELGGLRSLYQWKYKTSQTGTIVLWANVSTHAPLGPVIVSVREGQCTVPVVFMIIDP